MSTIGVRTNYTQQLWLEDFHANYSYESDSNTLTFGMSGTSITTEIELSELEQEKLVKCLISDQQNHIPHWQNLTPDLHRTVERIVQKIMQVSILADYSIRKSPKGIRLKPLSFERRFLNQSQSFPVLYWTFSDEERTRLKNLYSHLNENLQKKYDRGIMIPMPEPFERRQIFLTKEEANEIGETFKNAEEIEPYWELYSTALENCINYSFGSAVLILATSIETALKWWLNKNGDEIAKFLITYSPSPSIEKLYECARTNTEIDLPGAYIQWIKELRDIRNIIAHKPISTQINRLEIARWFAIGEAILKLISGHKSDKLVGHLVEPVGKKAIDKFADNSRGIVMRKEILDKEQFYHIMVDTGETWRFTRKGFKKSKNQDIK